MLRQPSETRTVYRDALGRLWEKPPAGLITVPVRALKEPNSNEEIKLRIYVAAKTHDHERASKLMRRLESEGHEITFDWTANSQEVGPDHENEKANDVGFLRECAENDVYGVKTAHAVVAIAHPRVVGTLIECGIAIAMGKPLYLIGEMPKSVFWALSNVTQCQNEFEFLRLVTKSWSIED